MIAAQIPVYSPNRKMRFVRDFTLGSDLQNAVVTARTFFDNIERQCEARKMQILSGRNQIEEQLGDVKNRLHRDLNVKAYSKMANRVIDSHWKDQIFVKCTKARLQIEQSMAKKIICWIKYTLFFKVIKAYASCKRQCLNIFILNV